MSRITFHNIQPFPYYLLLLPLFFVLHGYADYYDIVQLKDAFFLLLRYEMAALGLWVIFGFLFRSQNKAALFSFCLLCFHFFFGSLHDTAKTVFGDSFLVKYSFILPTSLAALILAFFLFRQLARPFNKLTTYFTLVLLVLITTDFILLVPKISRANKEKHAPLPSTFITCDTCARPDIYLIIADEYAGQEPLKNLLHFDSTAFENQLRELGFHVASHSTSNYNSTPFSMASLLNMEYLEGIKGDHDNKNDIKQCYDKINNSLIARFFKKQGYEIKSYSVFNFSDIPTQANTTLFPIKARLISGQTFLSRLYKDLAPALFYKLNYKSGLEKILYADLRSNNESFSRTWREVTTPANTPRFVYTHLMMPHAPYYFNKNSELSFSGIINPGQYGREKEYVSYLQYCNKKFLELIEHLQTSSQTPPIIIFMSDHGFRYYDRKLDPKYQFMNINAVFLPHHQYSGFYNSMSNVNQFRVLLNTVFGQKLPLLKDSTICIK